MKRHPDTTVTVFAVWEPMLPTDWARPSTNALRRLHDPRVKQYWDPHHDVAAVLEKARSAADIKITCCTRRGVLWDLVAVYPPLARWPDRLGTPKLFNGTMVDFSAALDSAMSASQ